MNTNIRQATTIPAIAAVDRPSFSLKTMKEPVP